MTQHSPTTSSAASAPAARVIAFYLPQFHPIPENDLWWGAGFTEWTNVAKAKPLYPGHVQPRLPADLGFYDLRVPEVRERQAELAANAGVESFCYWHYWFGNGRRILERPFDEVLSSGKPNFSFCLAWANETWTDKWHGTGSTRVLMEQLYPGAADREAHFNWARRAFEDPRHTTVDGKPLFVVYASVKLPSTAEFIDHWRELAHKAGYPGMYFVAAAPPVCPPGEDRYHRDFLEPFDAVTILDPADHARWYGRVGKLRRLLDARYYVRQFNHYVLRGPKPPVCIDFPEAVAHAFEDMPEGERFLPTVLAGWDNTPRSGSRGVVYEHFTPELLKTYLGQAIARVSNHSPSKKIVFLKAWNEWAEGNILEPDSLFGHQLLDATRSVVLPQAGAASALSEDSAGVVVDRTPAEQVA